MSIAAQPPVQSRSAATNSAACLSALVGTWRGLGTIRGRPIVMEQRWERSMQGAFFELQMRHFDSDTGTRVAFEGRGFYRPTGLSTADSIAGTWFDARGFTMSLAASCSHGTLSSHWTGRTERGRTIYALRDGVLEVIDSVYLASGEAREFGRSRLTRRP